MRVTLYSYDKAPLEWGLAKIHKMGENVVKMSTFLRIESKSAAKFAAACDRAKTLLAGEADRPNGFGGEVEIADDMREVLYTAAVAWLRECNDKLTPTQTTLTIGLTETDKRRLQVENLRDRLQGIVGIFDGADAPEVARATHPAEGSETGADDDDEDEDDDDAPASGGGDADWDQGPDAHRKAPEDGADVTPISRGKIEVPAGVAAAAAGRKASGKGLA
jgi:hypothetical protein